VKGGKEYYNGTSDVEIFLYSQADRRSPLKLEYHKGVRARTIEVLRASTVVSIGSWLVRLLPSPLATPHW